jgi:PBSX family phage portal protein
MRLELSKLNNFFDFCCFDESFVQLRRKTRQDREVIGYGFWEVLRNKKNDPAQFTYLPAFTVRLLPLDAASTEVDVKRRITPLTFETVKMRKRFRRFVQVFGPDAHYFKEYGDPRTVSSRTGRIFEDDAAMMEAEGEEVDGMNVMPPAATEIMYFPIHNPQSSYGVPRWIGSLLSVIGSRQSEEVNFLYFDNKSVPPLAILVSGGSLSADSSTRINDFLNNDIKGRGNFHSVLVLEAQSPNTKSAADAGKTKIDLQPLTKAQHNDALFQKYDERNIDKVGMAFRLPRMLRGDVRDFNRSTADAALNFAEMQVFQPEREEFDFIVNRKLLLQAFGIRYWTFVSNAPISRNPEVMSNIIRNLANAGVIWPELGIRLAQDVFNKSFAMPDDDWIKQPIALTVAGVPIGQALDEESFGEDADDDDDDDDEGVDSEKSDLAVSDMAAGGGLKQPDQARRRRRRLLSRRGYSTADAIKIVKRIFAMRDAMIEAERLEAEAGFAASQKRIAGDEHASS